MDAPRFTPLKPKVHKRDGAWGFTVPMIVFGDNILGRFYGPLHDWNQAVQAAIAITAGIHREQCRRNSGPLEMRHLD